MNTIKQFSGSVELSYRRGIAATMHSDWTLNTKRRFEDDNQTIFFGEKEAIGEHLATDEEHFEGLGRVRVPVRQQHRAELSSLSW